MKNGGSRICIAGPIASLLIEKYLRQKTRVDLEKKYLQRVYKAVMPN
jgi:penicillin-binding protein 2